MTSVTCDNCQQKKVCGQYVEGDNGEILCAFCFMTNFEYVVSQEEAIQSYDMVITVDAASYGRTTDENQFRR